MEMIQLTLSSSMDRKVAVDPKEIEKIEPDGGGSRIILKTKDKEGNPHRLLVKEKPDTIQI